MSVATTERGSVLGGEGSGIDDAVFLRPRTPPRRDDRHQTRAEEDHSEESDAHSLSATTSSSYDDLSKDIEDKVRNN